MSQPVNPQLFENIEHHLASAGKSIIRGLLAACAGVVLMWMINVGIASATVSIPGLDIKVPTLIGALVFVLTTTVFGVAAAARVLKVRNLENHLSFVFPRLPENEQTRFLDILTAAITRRSPIWGKVSLFFVTLCGYLLHTLYWYILFEFAGWEHYQGAPLWLRSFLGQLWMSFGMATFTIAPFGFLYLVRIRIFETLNVPH